VLVAASFRIPRPANKKPTEVSLGGLSKVACCLGYDKALPCVLFALAVLIAIVVTLNILFLSKKVRSVAWRPSLTQLS